MATRLKFISLLSILCLSLVCHAQTNYPKVDAAIEPDSIGVGDRFTISVEVDKDMTQVVEFPYYKDGDFGNGLEIQDQTIDTLSIDGRRLKLRKNYIMIAFEEGLHQIGRFPVLYIDKNIIDTLYSSSELLLEVGTFEIDTLTQTIYDIKKPMGAPTKFGEYSGYALAILLFILLLSLGIYFVIKSRKGLGKYLFKPKQIDPPHLIAINELKKLHAQKLWQSGKYKLYYTRMTDILREYLDKRYDIRAMEMTSDEIIEALRGRDLPDRDKRELNSLLKIADLVKFAKYIPNPDENEDSYNGAYYFVEDTKQQNSVSPDETHTREDER